MKEYVRVRQIPGERKRRWFASDDFELIVWSNGDGSPAGFELCYDKLGAERAIVWRPDTGFSHAALDDGEGRPGRYKATPIHVAAGRFDARRVYLAFREASRDLPPDVAAWVLQILETHPDWGAAAQDPD